MAGVVANEPFDRDEVLPRDRKGEKQHGSGRECLD
jgi:hypothetical protein